MGLWSIIGERGSGKTIFIVLCVEDAILSKRDVYINFNISLPHKKLIIEQIIKQELKNALIGLDEAHIYLDSRQSGSTFNRVFSYFIYQSRKTDVDVMVVSQFATGIDVRLRSTADFHIICEKLKDETGFIYSVCKRRESFTPFSYNDFQGLEVINRFVVFKKQLIKIFKIYDTYALIDISEVEEQKKHTKEIINEIKEQGNLTDKEKDILSILKKGK